MKKYILLFVTITAFSFVFAGCKKTGGAFSSTDGPEICTIDGVKIPLTRFKKSYEYFLKMNYPQGKQELYKDDKDEMKKYYQTQFLPQEIFYKYAIEEPEFKNDPEKFKKIMDFLKRTGIIGYATFLDVQAKYNDPNEAKLKEFEQQMERDETPQTKKMVEQMRKQPPARQREILLEFYKRFMMQKMTMEFLNKAKEGRRIIRNDDLEQNLLNKYIEDQISIDDIMNDNQKKYWLLKIDEIVISAQEFEKDLQMLVYFEQGDETLKKYLENEKTRKNMRKMLWEKVLHQYIIYYYAIKNKFNEAEDCNFFVDAMVKSTLAKVYVMKKLTNKIPEATESEIEEAYNKMKKERPEIPALNREVRQFIGNQIKQQKGQVEMLKLFERLKERNAIVTNESVFKLAEETQQSGSQSSGSSSSR